MPRFSCSSFLSLIRLVVPALAAMGTAGAQDVDAAWKELYIKAQRAAVDHDFPAAQTAFESALHEAERFGPADTRVANTLNSLGIAQRDAKHLSEAETSFRRALAILEAGPPGPSQDMADVSFNLAGVLIATGKPQPAIALLSRSLSINEQLSGGQSVRAADVHCALGDAYVAMKLYSDAEGPLKRCAAIREQDGGMLNPGFGDVQISLAFVYTKQGRFALAEQRYRLAARIRERTLGITSPVFAEALEAHAAVLKTLGRD